MTNDQEAFRAIVRSEQLPQSMVRRLWREGLIEVDDDSAVGGCIESATGSPSYLFVVTCESFADIYL